MGNTRYRVTRSNLREALEEALKVCKAQMVMAKQPQGNYQLFRDLDVAIDALEAIKGEIEGRYPQRPKGQRSGPFSRYVVDEREQMAMDKELINIVCGIEHIYSRFY